MTAPTRVRSRWKNSMEQAQSSIAAVCLQRVAANILGFEPSEYFMPRDSRDKHRGRAAKASCRAQVGLHCDRIAPNEAKISDFSKIPAVSTPPLP